MREREYVGGIPGAGVIPRARAEQLVGSAYEPGPGRGQLFARETKSNGTENRQRKIMTTYILFNSSVRDITAPGPPDLQIPSPLPS